MESKQKEVWFWMYCKHCKDSETDQELEPCAECLGEGYNWDSHKPINYRWDGVGDGPIYDSTDERMIWHDKEEEDESRSEDSTNDE